MMRTTVPPTATPNTLAAASSLPAAAIAIAGCVLYEFANSYIR